MNMKKYASLSAIVFLIFAMQLLVSKEPLVPTASAQTTTFSCGFYKLDVIAKSGQLELKGIEPGVSINDAGQVAFIGRLNNERTAVFVADGTSPPTTVATTTSDWKFHEAIQINDNSELVTFDQLPVNRRGDNRIRKWDSSGQPVTVAWGKHNHPGADFDGVFSYPSINNRGNVVFSAQVRHRRPADCPQTCLATPNASGQPDDFYKEPVQQPVRPFIADNDAIVVRAGIQQNSPIRFYQSDFSNPQDIATAAMGFSRLGLSPGISDDGSIVVFSGVKNAKPGIFASVEIAGVRQTPPKEIVSEKVERVFDYPRLNAPVANPPWGNDDGICDPAEAQVTQTERRCLPVLGTDENGGEVFFQDIDLESRVAVEQQEFGPPGAGGDSFIVAFVGTPNRAGRYPYLFTNQKGIWTLRLELKDGKPYIKPFSVLPVVQVADKIDGRTIQDVALFDPIASVTIDNQGNPRTQKPGEHQLAFRVATDQGDMVIRATYLDTDGDALLDHWEASGIDANRDCQPDLDLQALGANPRHKDIFVEIDWMSCSQSNGCASSDYHHHLPNAAALELVRKAYAEAPVGNPDSQTGITLHHIQGESLREIEFVQKYADLQYGPSRKPCAAGSDAYFGSKADRANMDCMNILAAKGLAYRYAVYGHQLAGQPRVLGISDNPGHRFFIAMGAHTDDIIQAHRGLVSAHIAAEATTFMHELGHTLNLRHGGSDDLLCKPNYLSVMSYTGGFQQFDKLRPLDYSRSELYPLQETALSEPLGIIGPPGLHAVYGVDGLLRWAPADGPIDWNNDGDAVDIGVSEDVDNFSGVAELQEKCGPSTATVDRTLQGFNDWENLLYDFRSTGAAANLEGAARTPDEVTGDEMIAGARAVDFDGDGVSNYDDNCPANPNPNQADTDGDGVGNTCDTDEDTRAPTLSIALPAPDTSIPLGSDFTVNVTAADDLQLDVVTVSFDLDGDGANNGSGEAVPGARIGTDTYEAIFPNLRGLPGTRIVETFATDAAGNASRASIPVLIVESGAGAPLPTIRIETPAPGVLTPLNGDLMVRLSATGPLEVTSVTVLFDSDGDGHIGRMGEVVQAGEVGRGIFEATFRSISGPSGARLLRAFAVDASLQIGAAAAAVVVADTTGPVLRLSQPVPGQLVSPGRDLTVHLNATDDVGVGAVTVSFDVDGDGAIAGPGENLAATRTGDDAFEATLAAVSGPDGSRTIQVSATDASNNTGVANRTVTIGDRVPIVGLGTSVPFEMIFGLGEITSVAFSPDGQKALIGGKGSVAALVDLNTGLTERRFFGHTAEITSVAFSQDGTKVVTGSMDDTARLWDVASGALLRVFSHTHDTRSFYVTSVAFSPDGRQILTGTGARSLSRGIELYGLAVGGRLRSIDSPF